MYPQQLDFEQVLETLQEALGERVIVIIAGAHKLLVGDNQEPSARFSGRLRRAHNGWEIEHAFDDGEVLFLVGADAQNDEHASWFALSPSSFIGAHRNEQDLTVVCGDVALVITWEDN